MGRIKIQAKSLLLGNTMRLAAISFLSFFLRWGAALAAGYLLWFLYDFRHIERFLALGNRVVMTLLLLLGLNLLRLGILLWICGIRLGEQAVYLRYAAGQYSTPGTLFSFLSPKKAVRAFVLYSLIWGYRGLWLFYFLFPAAAFGFLSFVLAAAPGYPPLSIAALFTATAFLAFLGILACFKAGARYRKAVYLSLRFPEVKPAECLRRSIAQTDGTLASGVHFRFTLLGWIFPGLLLVPLIYVVPYCRMACALETQY